MLDICILTYATAERDLLRLMDEIKMHTPIDHEVHVLTNFGNKLNVSAARNNLANDGGRNFIAFLEPDVHLEVGWASALLWELEAVRDAGCIVPRMLAPDIQKNAYPDKELKDRLAFHAVVMRRTTWKALRGFDERFRFFGADGDFRKRLGLIEQRDTIVSSNVSMVHNGGAMLKGAMAAGGLDLSKERVHKQQIENGLNDLSLKYWHELRDTEMSACRQNHLYQIQ